MLSSANLYLSADRAIIAACHHNADGVRYEQEDPIIILNWQYDESITEALREALKRFSFRERNLRESKKSDWPAYIASDLRSVSDFERKYLRVSIVACNEAGALCTARAEPAGERNITVESTLSFGKYDSDVAQDIKRLYEVCSKWDLMLF